MGLFKEYEKQRKYNKRFVRFMIFLFFFLPLVMWLTKKTELFFIVYLILLEILILVAVGFNKDKDALEFDVNDNKIAIRMGLWKSKCIVLSDKVVAVHTDGEGDELQIVILTTQRSRSKFFKSVTKIFLKRYSEVSREYLRLKKQNPELNYFYIIIKKGGFYKYELLETLYKKCTYSKFTSSCIESIKKIKY